MAVVSTVSQKFKHPAQTARTVWQKPLFRDRLLIGFILLAIALSLIILIGLLVKVRPKDFVVPLQYSTLQGFDSLGSWYQVYLYGVFSVLITVANITLALMSYAKSRITSFFLILGTIIINIFAVIIVFTLLSHLNF